MKALAPPTHHASSGAGPLSPGLLVRTLDSAFHGPAWHGPALEQTLKGCTHAEAERRLAAGRNTIRELVLHAAYGKYIVRARLTKSARRFPRPLRRSWWPRVVDPSAEGWLSDLELLGIMHATLVESVGNMSALQLARRRPGKQHSWGDEIIGIVLHDTYHAGQIALIRKLTVA